MLILLWGSWSVLEIAAHETEDAFTFHLSWKGAVWRLYALSVLHVEWGLGVQERPWLIQQFNSHVLSDETEAQTEGDWVTPGYTGTQCQSTDLNHVSWTSLCGHVINLFLDFSRSTWICLIIYPSEVTLSSWCMQLSISFPWTIFPSTPLALWWTAVPRKRNENVEVQSLAVLLLYEEHRRNEGDQIVPF